MLHQVGCFHVGWGQGLSAHCRRACLYHSGRSAFG